MDSTTITLSSHNINGFSNSREYLYSRCKDECNAIFAIQEHWLKPQFKKQKGVGALKSLHPDYDGFGTSAMTDRVGKNVIKGRPYGGTGFLFSKSLSMSIRPWVNYIHERVSILELSDLNREILLINAYLPFYDTSNLNEQIILYKETIGYIENVIRTNPNHEIILMMDMNCNIKVGTHPFSRILLNFMTENNIISTFDLVPNFDFCNSFTRCDIKTGSYTLIDGILISKSLTQFITNVRISHYGNNVSDHSPVELDLSLNLCGLRKKNQNVFFF